MEWSEVRELYQHARRYCAQVDAGETCSCVANPNPSSPERGGYGVAGCRRIPVSHALGLSDPDWRRRGNGQGAVERNCHHHSHPRRGTHRPSQCGTRSEDPTAALVRADCRFGSHADTGEGCPVSHACPRQTPALGWDRGNLGFFQHNMRIRSSPNPKSRHRPADAAHRTGENTPRLLTVRPPQSASTVTCQLSGGLVGSTIQEDPVNAESVRELPICPDG